MSLCFFKEQNINAIEVLQYGLTSVAVNLKRRTRAVEIALYTTEEYCFDVHE